jgi:hypothetical protein
MEGGNSDRWSRYGSSALSGGTVRAAYQAWQSHATSLGYLLRYCPPPANVISIGCGAALFDVLLVAHGYKVTSVDNDDAVLEMARRVGASLSIDLDLHSGDAFDLSAYHGHYDVAFSAGLVEHWNGSRTVDLIREHARCAPLVQVEVPTSYTRLLAAVPGILDDAKLYGPSEFASRVRDAGLRVKKLYPIGGVPTTTRRIVESTLPKALFRWLQVLVGYSMGIGCIALREPSAELSRLPTSEGSHS